MKSPKRISQPKLSNVLDVAPFERADAVALQALSIGNADEHQQKRVLDWILYKACDFHGISFRPESERESSFAEGKRHIAQQINVLLTYNLRIQSD